MILDAAKAAATGYLAAARVMVAPYLDVIRMVVAIVVLLATLFAVWRVHAWREGYLEREAAIDAMKSAQSALKREQDCLTGTICANRVDRLAADGVTAVEKARKAAQEAAKAEQAKLAAEGQAAVKRAEQAASVARVRLSEAEARLAAAIVTDPGCEAQSRERLACPLGP